jgi:hypothetical protein
MVLMDQEKADEMADLMNKLDRIRRATEHLT